MSETEAKVSHIGGLIPQVFYDLIGRIVPGAFLLFIGFLLINGEDWKQRISDLYGELKISYSLSDTLGLLFSYMIGILLGGIGYFLERIIRRRKEYIRIIFGGIGHCAKKISSDWKRHNRISFKRIGNFKKRIFCKKKEEIGTQDRDSILAVKKPNINSISYIYDVIQYYEPAAGARLAKLIAERNMCRVLMVGSILLEIWHVLKDKVFLDYWLCFFVFCFLSSYLFYTHLISRSRALVRNYRDIFARENKKAVCVKRCQKIFENEPNEPEKKGNTNCHKEEDRTKDEKEIVK